MAHRRHHEDVELRRGDHILTRKGRAPFTWEHHAIVTQTQPHILVVQYDRRAGEPMRIRQAGLAKFMKGSRYDQPRVRVHGHDEYERTAQRATSLLGRTDYNGILQNCEHMAEWAATGSSRCLQVERWLIAGVCVGMFACALGLVGCALTRKREKLHKEEPQINAAAARQFF